MTGSSSPEATFFKVKKGPEVETFDQVSRPNPNILKTRMPQNNTSLC